MAQAQWKLVIHGGAGAMRPDHGDADHEQRARQGLRDALDAGSAVLSEGWSAVDAVEAAVRVLEDDVCFMIDLAARDGLPLVHLDHPRGYADPAHKAANKARIRATKRGGRFWTPDGIVKRRLRPRKPGT